LYRTFITILFLAIAITGRSQASEIAAINNFIEFNNECTHGMLIVHRLLENFNQEVNKFVDLESQQVNFYSNKDLPKNLFEDTEHWFYEVTPYEWYDKISEQKLAPKWNRPLMGIAKKMRETVSKINSIRFEAESFIATNDLSKKSNQDGIYAILEKGVDLFEDFYLKQKSLKKYIGDFAEEQSIKRNSFETWHEQAYEMLEDLRLRNDNEWDKRLNELKKFDLAEIRSQDQRRKVETFVLGAQEFIETAEVSPEYKLYGKYYFYHNSKLLNYVNRYGNGYVNAYNQTLDRKASLLLFEIPHFYQVIYPKKWLEDVPLVSMDPSIVELPERLKDRTIAVNDRIIFVDSEIVELEVFDHQMIDGDIVSINFNGDWILQDYHLKGKPYPLKVKLNKSGKNYILLHAINLGRKPPNTMALRYKFQGKNETVVLTSNLDQSEIIEIRLAQ
jgi:hypothetical protein